MDFQAGRYGLSHVILTRNGAVESARVPEADRVDSDGVRVA